MLDQRTREIQTQPVPDGAVDTIRAGKKVRAGRKAKLVTAVVATLVVAGAGLWWQVSAGGPTPDSYQVAEANRFEAARQVGTPAPESSDLYTAQERAVMDLVNQGVLPEQVLESETFVLKDLVNRGLIPRQALVPGTASHDVAEVNRFEALRQAGAIGTTSYDLAEANRFEALRQLGTSSYDVAEANRFEALAGGR